jgi:NAD(P)-dependent dehydrogenase (short-subunit alcohol dehydrogenase family)
MAYEQMSLAGRTAVVIGGTSGIGRALALGLGKAGAAVVATGRRRDQVHEVANELEAQGTLTVRQACDVTEKASLEALLARSVEAFGQVDILVNCAGRTRRGPTVDFPEAEFREILECNLMGTLRGCQVFGAHMLKRGYGRIINIASLTTFVGFQEVAAYSASKAAVGSLTQSLAVEWGAHGVCVNAIAPGVYRTDLNAALLDGTPRGQELKLRTPMRRFGDLGELVGAAIFLASESASFVNGAILPVDGGFLASGVNQ